MMNFKPFLDKLKSINFNIVQKKQLIKVIYDIVNNYAPIIIHANYIAGVNTIKSITINGKEYDVSEVTSDGIYRFSIHDTKLLNYFYANRNKIILMSLEHNDRNVEIHPCVSNIKYILVETLRKYIAANNSFTERYPINIILYYEPAYTDNVYYNHIIKINVYESDTI